MIQLLITGGTIDKHYNELNGELYFPPSHLPEMLRQARCTAELQIDTVLLKDSLDINEADRALIQQACIDSPASRILISHGTDTMVTTAQQLAATVADKTIVLFGAMVPFSIHYSDALFNLGCAISAVQLLPAGVYISMNGQLFNWDNVTKDRQAGEFKATPAA